jgi:hypothetical protein
MQYLLLEIALIRRRIRIFAALNTEGQYMTKKVNVKERDMFDYFYADRAEQFVFFKIPKALFTDAPFNSLSTESRVLYGLMLDRMGLSRKNGWIDRQGRVYIYFTQSDVMSFFSCAKAKASKLMSELSGRGVGLIETRRQGIGRANIIYVKDFTTYPARYHTHAEPTYIGKSNRGA